MSHTTKTTAGPKSAEILRSPKSAFSGIGKVGKFFLGGKKAEVHKYIKLAAINPDRQGEMLREAKSWFSSLYDNERISVMKKIAKSINDFTATVSSDCLLDPDPEVEKVVTMQVRLIAMVIGELLDRVDSGELNDIVDGIASDLRDLKKSGQEHAYYPSEWSEGEYMIDQSTDDACTLALFAINDGRGEEPYRDELSDATTEYSEQRVVMVRLPPKTPAHDSEIDDSDDYSPDMEELRKKLGELQETLVARFKPPPEMTIGFAEALEMLRDGNIEQKRVAVRAIYGHRVMMEEDVTEAIPHLIDYASSGDKKIVLPIGMHIRFTVLAIHTVMDQYEADKNKAAMDELLTHGNLQVRAAAIAHMLTPFYQTVHDEMRGLPSNIWDKKCAETIEEMGVMEIVEKSVDGFVHFMLDSPDYGRGTPDSEHLEILVRLSKCGYDVKGIMLEQEDAGLVEGKEPYRVHTMIRHLESLLEKGEI